MSWPHRKPKERPNPILNGSQNEKPQIVREQQDPKFLGAPSVAKPSRGCNSFLRRHSEVRWLIRSLKDGGRDGRTCAACSQWEWESRPAKQTAGVKSLSHSIQPIKSPTSRKTEGNPPFLRVPHFGSPHNIVTPHIRREAKDSSMRPIFMPLRAKARRALCAPGPRAKKAVDTCPNLKRRWSKSKSVSPR